MLLDGDDVSLLLNLKALGHFLYIVLSGTRRIGVVSHPEWHDAIVYTRIYIYTHIPYLLSYNSIVLSYVYIHYVFVVGNIGSC